MIRSIRLAGLFCLITAGAATGTGTARAQEAVPGLFQCTLMANSAEAAFATMAGGKLPVKFEITEKGFWFGGGLLVLQGPVKTASALQAGLVRKAASTGFTPTGTALLDAVEDPGFATAAFGKDAKGARAALILSRNGKGWFACMGDKADEAEPGIVAKREPGRPVAEGGLSAGDLTVPPPPAPQQKGKEAKIFGPVKPVKVEAGRYQCTTASYYSNGDKKETKSISSLDATGFDLFADGGYRLLGDETGTGIWRSGPAAGAIAFHDGSLKVYMKEAIHILAKNEFHLIYQVDYNYDDTIDDLVLCGRTGGPEGLSPREELVEKGKKHLATGPAGDTRIEGLYYKIDWRMMVGANFTTYQVPDYTFFHFQKNGYVWLGEPPEDGNFAALACDKPMVDDKGEPVCTSYDIGRGTIRIGIDKPAAFEKKPEGLDLDGDSYFLIEPMQDFKLDRAFSYFSYDGVAAVSKGMSFTRAGDFRSNSSVGISYTTPDTGGPQTTVTGYNEKQPLAGRYALNGHTIEITLGDGRIVRKFFAVLSEGMLYFEGRAYTDG
jgi:hypothetical protein